MERVRSAYSASLVSPAMGALQTKVAERRSPKNGLTGIVQIGTGFAVPRGVPLVTYEDMTIKQALAYPYRHWRTLTAAQIRRRVALQQRCYDEASGVVLTNSWAARSVRDDYGVPAERVHVAGVGSHEEQRIVDRDWGTPRFLFVGIDWERKNGPRVLEGFRAVREVHPDARLDVVGGHPELDAPGVFGHGRLRRDRGDDRARLRSLFDAATCFVMPSLFEPSAVVYTEALACGLPAIGTTVGGSEDLIGNAGRSVEPTSQEAVTAAMLGLADPREAQRVSDIAVERAPLFTWQAVAERLLRAIDPQLLGRPLADHL